MTDVWKYRGKSKTSKTVAKLLFVVGALVYLVGLWISCPLLSGKGYFLGVLMTA
ncbi:hypothetical protein LAW85_23195, partial [Escherichia coli]|nr:hypothetical protein [Escherichia coli]